MKSADRPTTEAELCDAFTIAAERSGWDVYPEVGGWDLVLVWTGRTKLPAYHFRNDRMPDPGYQIAVEAKLRPNCDAIWSAVSRARSANTPRGDETAVLVPHAPREFFQLCTHLKLRVFTLAGARADAICPLHEPRPGTRLTLPPIALQGSGGAPSPRTMSRWRVGALRICAVLRSRGWITRDDFRAHRVDRSRWVAAKWIVADGKMGSLARYVPGPRFDSTGPEVGYEKERAALAALDAQAAAVTVSPPLDATSDPP